MSRHCGFVTIPLPVKDVVTAALQGTLYEGGENNALSRFMDAAKKQSDICTKGNAEIEMTARDKNEWGLYDNTNYCIDSSVISSYPSNIDLENKYISQWVRGYTRPSCDRITIYNDRSMFEVGAVDYQNPVLLTIDSDENYNKWSNPSHKAIAKRIIETFDPDGTGYHFVTPYQAEMFNQLPLHKRQRGSLLSKDIQRGIPSLLELAEYHMQENNRKFPILPTSKRTARVTTQGHTF